MGFIARVLSILLVPTIAIAQAPSFRCDSAKSTVEDCVLLAQIEPTQNLASRGSVASTPNLFNQSAVWEASTKRPSGATNGNVNAIESLLAPQPIRKQGFHWKRALYESFVFLSIEHAYVVHDDF